MTHQARYRILVLAAIFSLLGEFPVLISVFSPLYAFSRSLNDLSTFVWLLAPVCGTYAFVAALRELRRIRKSPSTPLEARKMRLVAVLGACGTILWLPLAASAVLSFFLPADTVPPREHIINNFNNIAADAYQYTIRLWSTEGRLTTYEGYSMPKRMQGWPDERHFHYRIVSLYPDSIVIEGQYENDIKGAVRATIGSNCKLTNWQYFGDIERYKGADLTQ